MYTFILNIQNKKGKEIQPETKNMKRGLLSSRKTVLKNQ